MFPTLNPTLRGAIYGIGAASIWGGMYVVSDEVLKFIPPFTLLSIRLLIGALILATAIVALRGNLWLPSRDTLRLMLVGVVGFGISVGAQFVGTDLSTSINGAMITSASPAFILLFAWLILREPMTRRRIGAVALASIGVLIVIDMTQVDLGSDRFVGNVILAFAAITWGLYSTLIRRVSREYPTLTITAYGLIGGLLFCLPIAGFELSQRPVAPLNLNLLLGILYLGVISTAGAMWLWSRSFALVEASVASLFFFAQPLVGVLLSTLLQGLPITPEIILGGGLIIFGVLLSMQGERQLRHGVKPTPSEQT